MYRSIDGEAKRLATVVGFALATAVSLPWLAAAAAASTSTVGAFGCVVAGGHVTRPAGTEIVVRQGWATSNRGLGQDFINAQTSTISINSSNPVDVSGLYTALSGSRETGWRTDVFYPTDIILAQGESMTFRFVTSVSHTLLDGLVFESGDSGKPLLGAPGRVMDFTCTVTGA